MTQTLKQCLNSTSGNVLPMAAIGLLMTAALVGGGVDLSRAYKVQNRLQAACDAGVLSGRKAVASNGFDSGAEDQADAYFNANFDDDIQGTAETSFIPTSTDDGNTVRGTASTALDTTIMRIFGYDDIDLSVSCQASMGVGNSDITMVLDTTGSMDWELSGGQTRIEALREAMTNFYETVDEATAGTNARVRYSFVPYSSSVNVGALLLAADPDYLTDSYTYQSRQWVTETRQDSELVGYGSPVTTTDTETGEEDEGNWNQYSNTRYRTSASCQAALPANTAWANNGSANVDGPDTSTDGAGNQVTVTTSEQDQRKSTFGCFGNGTRYYIYRMYTDRTVTTTTTETAEPIYELGDPYEVSVMQYLPRTFDTSTFKTFAAATTDTGNSGANVSSTWNGCIIERETVSESDFAFDNTAKAITPEGAIDLDIDRAPEAGDASTQWAPMWGQVSYLRGTLSGRRGTTFNMVDSSPLSNGQAATSYCPVASQLLMEMDAGDYNDFVNSLNPTGSTYHDIGILWGARLASPTGIFADNVNEEPDNGGSVSRHMIFMTDGEMAPNNAILSSYGIEFYDKRITDDGSSDHDDRHNSRFLALCAAVKAKGIRLWVIALSTGLSTELSTCASPNSSFTAEDAADLNTAFEEIANQVGELRVTQ